MHAAMAGKQQAQQNVSDVKVGREPSNKRPNLEMEPASPPASMASMRTLLSEFIRPINDRLDTIDLAIETTNAKLGTLSELQIRMNTLETESEHMKTRVSEVEDDLMSHKHATEKMLTHIQSLEAQVQQSVHENQILFNESKAQKDKLLHFECHTRRENLQFIGIPESRYEMCEDHTVKICLDSGLDINRWSIARAHRLGPFNKQYRRPIIVKFQHCKERDSIWQCRRMIKSLCNVTITEDYPTEIVDRRRRLYPIVDAAYKFRDPKNPDLRYHAKIVVDKLVVNGTTYTVENLDQLPEPLRPETVSSPSNNHTVVFFTKNSPLSNHFPCTFTVKKPYTSIEQYLMESKALHFSDTDTARLIMQTDDPVRQKRLGKKVVDFDKVAWQGVVENIPRTEGKVFSKSKVLIISESHQR
jgi:hypothetical protein